jgi:membrane protein
MAESEISTERQIRTIWNLGGLTAKGLARRVWSEIDQDDVLNYSAALAYSFLGAMFPLLLFLTSLLGLLAQRGATQLNDLLFSGLAQMLPGGTSQLITTTLNEITKAAGGGKMTVGIVLGLVSASSGMSTMISGLNAAYDIRDNRPWWKSRGIALGLTIALILLMTGALFIVLFGGLLAGHFAHTGGIGPVVYVAWKVLQWPLALFFVTFCFALIYYYGPDVHEQHWYWITPGSIVGVSLWLAASFGLRLYLHFYNSYSRSYGSLGAVILLMLWFYVTGLAFLIGGEINSEIEHAAARRGHPEAKAEGEKKAA